MRLLLLIGFGLTVALSTCRPKQDDAVLPSVARIKIVSNRSQQQLYFVENSTNNQITLNVTYYDANNSVITPMASPQFLVNGKPFSGNTYALDQPGQYTFTAQIGNRTSDNAIGPVTVGRVADYVSTVKIKAAVSFLNADSISRLPLVYEALDKKGNPVDLLYHTPKLLVNGSVNEANNAFVTGQAGQYTLQADFLGIRSNTLTVTARKPINYPVVRLPVVIHVPQSMSAAGVDPLRILGEVNKTFRKRIQSVDPNQADAYIEFYPAKMGPDGQPLAVAGLHQLSFDNPTLIRDASSRVTTVLRDWCPQQYINVFLGIDWLRTYPTGYSFSYLPNPSATRSALTCDNLRTINWVSDQIPAIYINDQNYNQNSFGVLAHELGHFLGLQHTFAYGCSDKHQVLDTPRHEEAQPFDKIAAKFTCDKSPFTSQYVMDYFVYQYSFTHEQVSLMQNHIKFSGYVPALSARSGGRRGAGEPITVEVGSTVSCAPR